MRCVIKGVSRKVIMVNSPDRRCFEQAIFILRDDADAPALSADDIVRQAAEATGCYMSDGMVKTSRHISPWTAAALSCAATALLIWIAGLIL